MKYKNFVFFVLVLVVSFVSFVQFLGLWISFYGIFDVNVQLFDGVVKQICVQFGGLFGLCFGLCGCEDFGGGLNVFFMLEFGINVDDGSYGQNVFWGCQVFVGFGIFYGLVLLGCQYGSFYILINEFSQFFNVGIGVSMVVIGGFGGYELVCGSDVLVIGNGGLVWVNNLVKFEFLNYGGFSVGVLWGMGEVVGNISGNCVVDVYGCYIGYGVDVMLFVVEDKVDVLGCNLCIVFVVVVYDWGSYCFNGGVMQVNDCSSVDCDGKGYWFGVSYCLGQYLFKGQYVESKNDGVLVDGKIQVFGVGYQYDLFKCIVLYSLVMCFKNEGVGYVDCVVGSILVGLIDVMYCNLIEVVVGICYSF